MNQKNNNRIGLLTPTLQSGGAERVISITSKILEDEGYEVYILIYDTEDISFSYSGKIINLESKPGKHLIGKMLKRIQRIIKVSYYRYKYDLNSITSFLYSANIVNYYSKGPGKRILACRGYSDFILSAKNYSKFQQKIDSFLVQTERMRTDFINDFNFNENKIHVVNNPFNILEIKEKSKLRIDSDLNNIFEKHTVICTVGTFKKDKGYWHLIKAFTLVKNYIPNALLVFIGHKGEMENEIKDMANRTEYPDDIIFLGYQSNPFKYIARSDLYVCTSIREGFPNSLVEAMACEAVVLSTDCNTGPREILHHSVSDFKNIENTFFADFGILVPKLDEKIDFNLRSITNEERILADGIVKSLSNKEKWNEYKLSSKKRAQDFDYTKYKDDILKLI